MNHSKVPLLERPDALGPTKGAKQLKCLKSVFIQSLVLVAMSLACMTHDGNGDGSASSETTSFSALTPQPAVPWSGYQAPAHPQVLFDAARLSALRAARTTAPYAMLHAFANAWLDWQGARADKGKGADGWYSSVGGYAVIAEIEQKHVDVALSYASAFCNSSWSRDVDLVEASQLMSASLAYDVLFHEPGFSSIEPACKSRMVTAARDLLGGLRGGQWWWKDYVNNHNWHDTAALGLAALALRGDATYGAEANTWRAAADADFATVSKAQAFITDGSWHEGAGYGQFGLSGQLLYWMGAERAGSVTSDDTPFVRNYSHHLLALQHPNHPRTYTLTTGDWVWPRPTDVAMFKWMARRFADPLAQEAGARWDLEGRSATTYSWLGRFDWAEAYAMEYAAYDPSVPATGAAVPLPVDTWNDDQGSFVMRSGWGASTSGTASQNLVAVLKNGYLGGKGNAQRMSSCDVGPGSELDIDHDHEDDFGLYLYGKGGWLLPEATGYNCCGTGTSSDPDAYQDSPWHNSVSFDGVGQLGDTKLSAGGLSIVCGSVPSWFAQRQPSMPVHASTAHFAIGQADGTRLYPTSLGLTRALRMVVMDRETSMVALNEEYIFAPGVTHTVEQHFHAMKGSTSAVAAPWLYLDNSVNPADAPAGTVNASSTVLGIQVVAPATAAMSVGVQQSNQFTEWMSPNGAYAHAVVSSGAQVDSARFLELLWPTTTGAWASRPSATALDATRPHRGFSIPVDAGWEKLLVNASGASSAAGGLQIDGRTSTDVAVVRNDGTRTTRMMLLAPSGARLSDQNGARTLLDLGTNGGALEVAFDGAGNADLSGTASHLGVKFWSFSAPTSVTRNGVVLAWVRDANTGLVTVTRL
jgi:hypothetical protein